MEVLARSPEVNLLRVMYFETNPTAGATSRMLNRVNQTVAMHLPVVSHDLHDVNTEDCYEYGRLGHHVPIRGVLWLLNTRASLLPSLLRGRR